MAVISLFAILEAAIISPLLEKNVDQGSPLMVCFVTSSILEIAALLSFIVLSQSDSILF
jgi:hypothetical protein